MSLLSRECSQGFIIAALVLALQYFVSLLPASLQPVFSVVASGLVILYFFIKAQQGRKLGSMNWAIIMLLTVNIALHTINWITEQPASRADIGHEIESLIEEII
jgi:hypothetical protein